MKLTITVEVIILCLILTLFIIFTIDSVSVRKAELLSIMSTDVDAVCNNFFDGKFENTAAFQHELEESVSSSLNSEVSDINIIIYESNIEQGIVELVVEITYYQPTGKSRSISMQRIYRDV